MTAEVLLNLVWLAIAAAAVVRVAVWARRAPAGARTWTAVIATACVVALLFPIISVTDDLSSDATVNEESSAIRRAAALVVVAAVLVAVVFDLAPLLRALVQRLAFLAFFAAPAAVVRPGFATVFSFRGPPAA